MPLVANNKDNTSTRCWVYLQFCNFDGVASGENYWLEPVDKNFALSFDHNYEYPLKEALSNKSSMRLLQGANFLRSASSVIGAFKGDTKNSDFLLTPVISDIPAIKNTSPLKVPNNLTFTFYFGQKGEFSGKTEVFNPIKELVKKFLPEKDATGLLSNLPFPTLPALLTGMVEGVGTNETAPSNTPKIENAWINEAGTTWPKNMFNVDSEGYIVLRSAPTNRIYGKAVNYTPPSSTPPSTPPSSEETPSENGEAEASEGESTTPNADAVAQNSQSLTDDLKNNKGVLDLISKLMNNISTKALGGAYKKNSFFTLKLGYIQSPACYCTDINFSFDMSVLDTNGYPLKGTLTLSGIKTMKVANKGQLI